MALITGLGVAIAAGTAIAVAATSGGPVPPKKPLARAIHDALGGPAVQGITARISFTNHLIDASNIQGSDPILTGATGRLWLSGDHRVRLELQSNNGDAQAVIGNGSFWVYDPAANTVYRGKLPSQIGKPGAADKGAQGAKNAHAPGLPSVAEIQSELTRVMAHSILSRATPGDTAGHSAYTVRISPKHDGGLLGAGELAFDAVRGIPLRVAVYAHGSSSPVLELAATDISYGPVPTSEFAVTPPSGARVVNLSVPAGAAHSSAANKKSEGRKGRAHSDVHGLSAVASRLHFKLLAPGSLVGLPRQSVSLLDWGGSPAALVSYGQNLGGIMVIEQTDKSTKPAAVTGKQGDHHSGLSLPTVSINGATGQELDTALGTVVRFTRGGVTYTVLGSVPPTAAEAAARAL